MAPTPTCKPPRRRADAGAMDVPPADVPAVDVQRTSPDVPLPTECNDVEVEDLVELGTLEGEVTGLTGDNRGLRNSNTLGLQPPPPSPTSAASERPTSGCFAM
ncbi:MAG: hypothetical protein IPN17_32835 [Deltaproteobacteria bacterium]|nr:hypothetical protein [Deltaproteobacteria bacterium]